MSDFYSDFNFYFHFVRFSFLFSLRLLWLWQIFIITLIDFHYLSYFHIYLNFGIQLIDIHLHFDRFGSTFIFPFTLNFLFSHLLYSKWKLKCLKVYMKIIKMFVSLQYKNESKFHFYFTFIVSFTDLYNIIMCQSESENECENKNECTLLTLWRTFLKIQIGGSNIDGIFFSKR